MKYKCKDLAVLMMLAEAWFSGEGDRVAKDRLCQLLALAPSQQLGSVLGQQLEEPCSAAARAECSRTHSYLEDEADCWQRCQKHPQRRVFLSVTVLKAPVGLV